MNLLKQLSRDWKQSNTETSKKIRVQQAKFVFALNYKNKVRIMHSIRNFQGVIITPLVGLI